MRSAALVLASLAVLVLAPPAIAQTTHYPVNDDGSHEISIQGHLGSPPGSTCDPPLGTMGGSFIAADLGDEAAGEFSDADNYYVMLSFDTSGWSCAGTFTAYLVEAGRFGSPFIDLDPEVVVEYRSSSHAYPDRLLYPAEVEGAGYSTLGSFGDVELFDPAGIDITPEVRGVVCGLHDRYLYLRFRFPTCTDDDSTADIVTIAARPGTPGRARIVEQGRGIPTLTTWGLIAAAVLLAITGAWALRRRHVVAGPA